MTFWEIAAYLIAALVAVVLLRIFIKPLRGILWLCINSALGGAGLFIFNMALTPLGFSVGINAVTAAICGLLGLPGLVLLIILKLVFSA